MSVFSESRQHYIHVIHFQVSRDRLPETNFSRMLLDENLRTQLLLLPAKLPALAYTPMNHRRLTSVGIAANDPQTDCWHFSSQEAEAPHVRVQQRLSLFKYTQDFINGGKNLSRMCLLFTLCTSTLPHQTHIKHTELIQTLMSAMPRFLLDLFQSTIVQTLTTHHTLMTKKKTESPKLYLPDPTNKRRTIPSVKATCDHFLFAYDTYAQEPRD